MLVSTGGGEGSAQIEKKPPTDHKGSTTPPGGKGNPRKGREQQVVSGGEKHQVTLLQRRDAIEDNRVCPP